MGAGCSDAPGLFFVCITWKEGFRRLFFVSLAFAFLLNALQSLAQAVVSTYVLCAVAYARVCGIIVFCLFFGRFFNIMSALFVHQLPTLLQKNDSREGLF